MNINTISIGPLNLSVCVPQSATKAKIEKAANQKHPTGISTDWKISEDTHFHTGQSNPCVCEQDCNRKHYSNS